MKEVGLYMMHILKYTFVIGILSGFYIHELLKKNVDHCVNENTVY